MKNFYFRSCSPLQSRILWAVFIAVLPIVVGCSDNRPKRVPVSGRVLIDGIPLELGFIRVVPQGDRAASGVIGLDGRFALKTYKEGDGCVLGTHPVKVTANKHLSSTKIKWFAPKKYSDITTSDLKIEVNGPRDDMEIHLTWEGSGHKKPYVEHEMGGE